MDPYAAAAAQAATPAAPTGATPAWGTDANAGMTAAAGWGGWDPSAAAGAWGAAPGAWGAYPTPAAPAWGGDAWGGKGGKGGKGGPKGGPRFSPYPKKGGPTTSVKIQPLPDGVGDADIRTAFSQYGEIASIRVMQGQPNYAYVNYTTTSAAAAAIAVNQVELGGQKCFINPGRPKYPDASDSIGLFNLPYATTQEELEKLVSAMPGFKKVKMIMKPGTTEFRGFAFADFDSVDNAVSALEALNGKWVGNKAIEVKFAAGSSGQGGWGGGKGKGKGDAGQWGGPAGAWGAPPAMWGAGGQGWW